MISHNLFHKNAQKWLVNTVGNAMVHMDNLKYLEHLLQVSKKVVKDNNNIAIRTLIWDLEQFKIEQVRFYNRFSMQIETEITSLKRILSYDLIR